MEQNVGFWGPLGWLCLAFLRRRKPLAWLYSSWDWQQLLPTVFKCHITGKLKHVDRWCHRSRHDSEFAQFSVASRTCSKYPQLYSDHSAQRSMHCYPFCTGSRATFIHIRTTRLPQGQMVTVNTHFLWKSSLPVGNTIRSSIIKVSEIQTILVCLDFLTNWHILTSKSWSSFLPALLKWVLKRVNIHKCKQ